MGVHRQRSLDADCAAEARVDPLQLVHDEAIGDVAHAGGAVLGGKVGSQKPHVSEPPQKRDGKHPFLPPLGHMRLRLRFQEVSGGGLDLALL